MKKLTAALLLTALLASLSTVASATDTGFDYSRHVSKTGESLFTIKYTEIEDIEDESDDEDEDEDTAEIGVVSYSPLVASMTESDVKNNVYTYTASIKTAKNVSRLTFDLSFDVDVDEAEDDSDELTVFSKLDVAVYGSKDGDKWEAISVSEASVEDGEAVLTLDGGLSYTDFKVVIYTDGQANIDNLRLFKTITLNESSSDISITRYSKYFKN